MKKLKLKLKANIFYLKIFWSIYIFILGDLTKLLLNIVTVRSKILDNYITNNLGIKNKKKNSDLLASLWIILGFTHVLLYIIFHYVFMSGDAFGIKLNFLGAWYCKKIGIYVNQ